MTITQEKPEHSIKKKRHRKKKNIDLKSFQMTGMILDLKKTGKVGSIVSYDVLLIYNCFQVNLTVSVEDNKVCGMGVISSEVLLSAKDEHDILTFIRDLCLD